MLDDDICGFGEVVGGKVKKTDATALIKAFNSLTKHRASLYSLELQQFAWCAKEIVTNRIAMQCVLFDVQACKNLDYDPSIKIREDYDLTFQAIFKANRTLRTAKYCYGIAAMKSQKGGMSEWYNDAYEKEQVNILCKKYPGLVTPVYKKNRYDVKVNWRKCGL